MVSAVILDVDGTLVDTNYQHAIAWDRAFARHDAFVELWRIHRHIGMGGDQLVAELAGDEVEERSGDDIRDAESELYGELIDEVRVIDGARELIAGPSGARHQGRARLLRELRRGRALRRDARRAETKSIGPPRAMSRTRSPQPDLVEAALEKAGTTRARHGGRHGLGRRRPPKRAGIPTIGVLTGGVSEAELREAGAVAVYESAMALADDLDSALCAMIRAIGEGTALGGGRYILREPRWEAAARRRSGLPTTTCSSGPSRSRCSRRRSHLTTSWLARFQPGGAPGREPHAIPTSSPSMTSTPSASAPYIVMAHMPGGSL